VSRAEVSAEVAAVTSTGPPRTGNRVTRALARVTLGLAGWRIEGEVPDEPKLLLIGAPHTSQLDLVLTKLTAGSLGVRLHWVGKKSLFPRPIAPIVRWYGGIPVNREASEGFVGAMVEEFRRRDCFYLALMPEGTIFSPAVWRSSFYHVAREADVPMVPIGFDWGRRTMRIGPVVHAQPNGSFEDEVERIREHFVDVRGRPRRPRPAPAAGEPGSGRSAV
jgi:1-acyl-sn-glycerol-3-phosphate acyltransferase